MSVEHPAIRILLIEDNPDDVFLFKTVLARLRERRFEMVQVERLAQALAWLDEHSPDIIVTDLNLPDSVGVTTVMRLILNSGAVPIIALTGWEDPVLGAQLIGQGAVAYWSKDRLCDTELPAAIVNIVTIGSSSMET